MDGGAQCPPPKKKRPELGGNKKNVKNNSSNTKNQEASQSKQIKGGAQRLRAHVVPVHVAALVSDENRSVVSIDGHGGQAPPPHLDRVHFHVFGIEMLGQCLDQFALLVEALQVESLDRCLILFTIAVIHGEET